FRTRADYESYLTRIAQYPRLNDEALAITANAVRGGHVLPCSVLGGYERTISGVIAADPAQSRFYEPFAATRPATISEADWAALNKEGDGWLPGLFGTLPRLTFTIRTIPAETAEGTTTAYYSQGSPESGIAGTYYVNTSRLNQRPLWEIPALSLHESVPGHHLQIALQQELDLAPFHRNFTSYTAFTEGWALYAESLGEEMGLYNTPERRMGELSYQMWRACRLVVDTGIHAFGWDKARAIAYMRENTALTDTNIEAEVNRYISWPGQALGYM